MSDSDGSPVKVASASKKKPPAVKRPPALHPSFADMVLDAVKSISDTKGASVPGIRNFVLEKYKAVDPNTMKYRLKQALTKLTEKEKIVRTKASEERPLMSSRFRVNKAKLAKESKPKKVVKEKTVKAKPKSEGDKKPKTKSTKATDKKSPKKTSTVAKVKKAAPKSPKAKPKAAKPKATAKTKAKTPKKTKTATKAKK